MQKTFTLFALSAILMLAACSAPAGAHRSTDIPEIEALPTSGIPDEASSGEMSSPVSAYEQARDVTVAHVAELGGLPLPEEEWSSMDQTQQNQNGDLTWVFTNGPWVVRVSVSAFSTEPIEYSVVVDHMSAIIRWQGRVDAYGKIVETNFIQGTQPDAPEESDEPSWIGVIISNPPGSQFDDYFQMMDQNGTRCGIDGADDALKEQLVSYRDSEIVIQVWGIFQKDVPDSFGAQILVTRIEQY